jgi:hypothetical protein
MDKKKRSWIMEVFMSGSMVMGAFMNVMHNVISGRETTAITRMHDEKKAHTEHNNDAPKAEP